MKKKLYNILKFCINCIIISLFAIWVFACEQSGGCVRKAPDLLLTIGLPEGYLDTIKKPLTYHYIIEVKNVYSECSVDASESSLLQQVFYNDSLVIDDTVSIPELRPGEKHQVNFTDSLFPGGAYNIKLIIDHENIITETNEENNTITFTPTQKQIEF